MILHLADLVHPCFILLETILRQDWTGYSLTRHTDPGHPEPKVFVTCLTVALCGTS